MGREIRSYKCRDRLLLFKREGDVLKLIFETVSYRELLI